MRKCASAHPDALQGRGGGKRIVAPDSSELAPATKPQPDGTLVKALARAWRWQRMLEPADRRPPDLASRFPSAAWAQERSG